MGNKNELKVNSVMYATVDTGNCWLALDNKSKICESTVANFCKATCTQLTKDGLWDKVKTFNNSYYNNPMLVYFTFEGKSAFVYSDNSIASKGKAGMVLATEGNCFLEDNNAAEYIGSEPDITVEKLNDVKDINGFTDFLTLNWLQTQTGFKNKINIGDDEHFYKALYVLDNLIKCKIQGRGRVILKPSESEVEDMTEILRKSLLLLPFQVANQLCFAVNAGKRAVNTSDFSYDICLTVPNLNYDGTHDDIVLESDDLAKGAEKLKKQPVSAGAYCRYLEYRKNNALPEVLKEFSELQPVKSGNIEQSDNGEVQKKFVFTDIKSVENGALKKLLEAVCNDISNLSKTEILYDRLDYCISLCRELNDNDFIGRTVAEKLEIPKAIKTEKNRIADFYKLLLSNDDLLYKYLYYCGGNLKKQAVEDFIFPAARNIYNLQYDNWRDFATDKLLPEILGNLKFGEGVKLLGDVALDEYLNYEKLKEIKNAISQTDSQETGSGKYEFILRLGDECGCYRKGHNYYTLGKCRDGYLCLEAIKSFCDQRNTQNSVKQSQAERKREKSRFRRLEFQPAIFFSIVVPALAIGIITIILTSVLLPMEQIAISYDLGVNGSVLTALAALCVCGADLLIGIVYYVAQLLIKKPPTNVIWKRILFLEIGFCLIVLLAIMTVFVHFIVI